MTTPTALPTVAAGAGPEAPRVAVIGTGALASEVVRNLGLVGVPATVHGADDFWRTLRLADLQDCYCAVAAGVDHDAGRRLNALCQVASVDLVCVASGARGITVETFPFGSDPRCACLECEPDPGSSDLAGPVPDPIAASVAGALAAAAALHCAGRGATRHHAPEVTEASTLAAIGRRPGCTACASPWRAPRVIRTRNRWTGGDLLGSDAAALSAQVVRLSDAIVTACECTECGPVAALDDLVNRPEAELAAARPTCPNCAAPAVRFEASATFSLGELTERFGRHPVPAKFALAEIGGSAVCFDLEAATHGGRKA